MLLDAGNCKRSRPSVLRFHVGQRAQIQYTYQNTKSTLPLYKRAQVVRPRSQQNHCACAGKTNLISSHLISTSDNTKPLSSRSSTDSAKIDSSDRKRKKTSSSRDKDKDKDKDKHKQKKKTRMSSSKTTTTTGQVRASHILIKHQGSRRKASWKDPEGRVIMNTTRDSAVSQLKSIRDDIVSGKAKFDDIATRLSDCSSAKRGGDLGQLLLFFSFFRS